MSIVSFRANLRHAISTRQTVSIGGGLFDTQDLEHVAARLARSDSDAGEALGAFGAEMIESGPNMPCDDVAANAHYAVFVNAWRTMAEQLKRGRADSLARQNVRDLGLHAQCLHADYLSLSRQKDSEHARAEANALEVVELREKLASAETRLARQAVTIRGDDGRKRELSANVESYREQRDVEGARAAKAELEASDCRTERDSLAARLTRSDARVAELQESNAKRAEALDLAERQAGEAEARLARLMTELGGLTLAQLPGGAYGGALADAYCDIKAGR